MGKTAKDSRSIAALVAEILATALQRGREGIAAWRNPAKDLERLARRDYVRALRRVIAYREVREIIASAKRIWPAINRAQLGVATKREFERRASRIASPLEVQLRASPYDGPEGLALLGFYLEQKELSLKRPLIYVNTAHVAGAMSSAFCHELGHHMTAQLFKQNRQPVHFFFDADYAAHLDDPVELAADVFVSLAGYPEPVARRLFSTPWNWAVVARTGKIEGPMLAGIRSHAEGRFGLDLAAKLPAGQKLRYLAGMIHYAKLRWALLAEYDL